MSPLLQSVVRAVEAPQGLVVLLHGLGSDEQDLFALSEFLDSNLAVACLRAPRGYEFGGFKWFSLGISREGISYDLGEARESIGLVEQSIREFQTKLGITREKTVLGGFSQGAMLSLAILLNSPRLARLGWFMSGAAIPELMPDPVEPSEKLRCLVQHGVDDEVIPIARGRNVETLLSGIPNIECAYREYPIGHSISMESLRDASDWIANSL